MARRQLQGSPSAATALGGQKQATAAIMSQQEAAKQVRSGKRHETCFQHLFIVCHGPAGSQAVGCIAYIWQQDMLIW